MPNTINARAAYVGETVIAMPRQMWLASLGAAVVTRDWAEKEARPMLKHLIKEGTVVETKAVRMVGDKVDSAFERANTFWRRTRSTMTTTVKQYADSAVALVRELPRSLPRVELPVVEAPAKPVRRARKAAKARTAPVVKRVKRAAKSAKHA